MRFLFRGLCAALLGAAVALGAVSCSSLQQDVVVSSELLVQQEDIARIEAALATVDAEAIMNVNPENRAKQCAGLLSLIDEAFGESGMQKALRARLYALQGRVLLLQGKKSDARSCYNESLKNSKGDAEASVLGSRLGLVDDLEDTALLAGSNQRALLVLERALQLYSSGEYLEALAKMDEAFLSLDDFYRTAYKSVRDSAWSLRSVSSSSEPSVQGLLVARTVTAGNIATITQGTTQLLSAYTGGKTLSEAALYAACVKEGLFSPASSVSGTALVPAAGDAATRILCARYLWNLYVAKRGNGRLVNRYSQVYRGSSEGSPIPDVPVGSEDFDAVLGCIENEIMELVDGIRFNPDGAVSGVEFNGWVSRLK